MGDRESMKRQLHALRSPLMTLAPNLVVEQELYWIHVIEFYNNNNNNNNARTRPAAERGLQSGVQQTGWLEVNPRSTVAVIHRGRHLS